MALRRMTPSDVDGCVRILQQYDPSQDAQEWVARFVRDIAGADKHPVVALVGDGIAGYGRTLPFVAVPGAPANAAPEGYYLLGLVVASSHQRRGLGRLLTQERLRWLRERGEQVAYYYTDRDNIASQELHEQLGFCRLTDNFWFPALPREHSEVLYRLAWTTAGPTADRE